MLAFVEACRLEDRSLENHLLPYAARVYNLKKPMENVAILGVARCEMLVPVSRPMPIR